MKTSSELLELCGAVRDETATPEQIARLEIILANEPDARRFYRRFTQVTALLERYEQLPSVRSEGAPVTRATRSVWYPRLGANGWIALAACVAVLAAVYWRLKPAPPKPRSDAAAMVAGAASVACVYNSHYCTVLPRVGPAVALNERYELRAGDIIATAPNGNAIIRFADEKTLFILSANTRAWIAREGSAKIVHLSSGQLFGDVAPQQNGAHWRILTPDGEAKVLGTQLAVSALAESTRVAVTSGRVRVTARDTRQSVDTPAGFAAQLTPTTATLVKLDPAEPTRVTSFTLIDADTNAAIAGFESLADGAVLDLAALPTRRLNIRANCEPQQVGMVRFILSGTDSNRVPLTLVQPNANGFPNQIEIYYPYMLAGDPSVEGEQLPQHSYSWTPAAGRYTLTATPYAAKQQWGARGDDLTVHFEVKDGAAHR